MVPVSQGRTVRAARLFGRRDEHHARGVEVGVKEQRGSLQSRASQAATVQRRHGVDDADLRICVPAVRPCLRGVGAVVQRAGVPALPFNGSRQAVVRRRQGRRLGCKGHRTSGDWALRQLRPPRRPRGLRVALTDRDRGGSRGAYAVDPRCAGPLLAASALAPRASNPQRSPAASAGRSPLRGAPRPGAPLPTSPHSSGRRRPRGRPRRCSASGP
jgi:hypothetical protein